MNQFWSGLMGALIGAAAAMSTAWITASRHERAEHRKWLRDQRRQACSDALRSLARATVIPIGTSVTGLENWFRELALVREALVMVQAYSTDVDDQFADVVKELVSIMSEYDFANVATNAATLEQEGVDKTGLVLWGVARIRMALDRALSQVTKNARNDLGRDTGGFFARRLLRNRRAVAS